MAFFRSIFKTLISQSSKKTLNPNSQSSRTFYTLCSSTTHPPFIYSYRHHYNNLRRQFLSPLSSTFGPLFLSSPPWKLSQYATPLLLQCDVVLLNLPPKVQTVLNLPYKLGFQPSQKLLKEGANGKNDDPCNASEFRDSNVAVPRPPPAAVGVTDSYLNLPNFISLSRLISGPVLGWMITQEMYLPAFVGLALSGATDWLDGYVARKMGINSVVGSYLDPLADKVLIGFVALAMVDRGLLHPGLVALVVLRDAALVCGAVYKRASSLEWQWKSWFDFFNLDGTRSEKVEPLFLSKVNTVFQLILVAAALLQPEFGNEETQSYITYLSWLVVLTTLGSTVAYGAQHLGKGSTSIKSSL